MPADVFKALDEIEYGFMRDKLEAEFASTLPTSSHIIHPSNLIPHLPSLSLFTPTDAPQTFFASSA